MSFVPSHPTFGLGLCNLSQELAETLSKVEISVLQPPFVLCVERLSLRCGLDMCAHVHSDVRDKVHSDLVLLSLMAPDHQRDSCKDQDSGYAIDSSIAGYVKEIARWARWV